MARREVPDAAEVLQRLEQLERWVYAGGIQVDGQFSRVEKRLNNVAAAVRSLGELMSKLEVSKGEERGEKSKEGGEAQHFTLGWVGKEIQAKLGDLDFEVRIAANASDIARLEVEFKKELKELWDCKQDLFNHVESKIEEFANKTEGLPERVYRLELREIHFLDKNYVQLKEEFTKKEEGLTQRVCWLEHVTMTANVMTLPTPGQPPASPTRARPSVAWVPPPPSMPPAPTRATPPV